MSLRLKETKSYRNNKIPSLNNNHNDYTNCSNHSNKNSTHKRRILQRKMKTVRMRVHTSKSTPYTILIPILPSGITIPDLRYWNQASNLIPNGSKRQDKHSYTVRIHLIPNNRTNLRMRKRKSWMGQMDGNKHLIFARLKSTESCTNHQCSIKKCNELRTRL